MATTYRVRLRLHSDTSVTALHDVLGQALDDAGDLAATPELERSGDDDPDLLVNLVVEATDASVAEVTARDAVGEALRRAGVSGDTIDLRDVDVRASS